jgi:S-formylglutathione hydrolase FrmB
MLGTEIAETSMTDWWPVRALLIALFVVIVVLLVWRAKRWFTRSALVVLALVVVAANVLAGVNAYYGYYLTVGQAIGLPGQDGSSLAALNRHSPPPSGIVVGLDIPGRKSHFATRTAQIYLPPAWFARPRPRLPVLVLLHGTPGDPTDWIDGGQAKPTLDAWAARHGGHTPIVIMPDINGSFTGDTECVGKAETYLTVDLPDFVHSRFFTLPPGRNWAVAGLSEGGACAIMLALRHPDLYGTFGDFGGLSGPRSGNGNSVGTTVSTLFGGSVPAFDEHEPGYLLSHQRFSGLGGWFEVGSADRQPLAAARALASLAERKGVSVHLVVLPGAGHTFPVWRRALRDSLPWLVGRVSLQARHSEPDSDG